MNDKVALWNSLEKTDPSHTKDFSGKGGFSGTSINGTYIIKKLTEAFGPCGRGWKFVIENESFVDGHLIPETNDRCKVHVIRGHLEYLQDGTWFSTGPQYGQTTFVGLNKYGPFTDEEAPKKSVTDCMGKCAVLIGIGADIHLGMFDDNKYVRKLEDEMSPPPPRPQPPPKPTQEEAKKAAVKFAQDAMEALSKIQTEKELTDWRKAQTLAKVDKLKDYDRELFDDTMAALNDATARVLGK